MTNKEGVPNASTAKRCTAILFVVGDGVATLSSLLDATADREHLTLDADAA